MTPCKIRWTADTYQLTDHAGNLMGSVTAGADGVLVYPGLAAFSPDLAMLYQVEEGQYETLDGTSHDLGGWDGETVTADLVKTLLGLDSAIPMLVEVMNDNPDLGPKVVQGVMAGLA